MGHLTTIARPMPLFLVTYIFWRHLRLLARVLLAVDSLRMPTIKLPAEKDPNEPTVPLRLGDWLVRRQLITRGQLFMALKRAYRQRCRLGDSVVLMGLVDRQTLEDETQILLSFNAFCGQPSTWTHPIVKP